MDEIRKKSHVTDGKRYVTFRSPYSQFPTNEFDSTVLTQVNEDCATDDEFITKAREALGKRIDEFHTHQMRKKHSDVLSLLGAPGNLENDNLLFEFFADYKRTQSLIIHLKKFLQSQDVDEKLREEWHEVIGWDFLMFITDNDMFQTLTEEGITRLLACLEEFNEAIKNLLNTLIEPYKACTNKNVYFKTVQTFLNNPPLKIPGKIARDIIEKVRQESLKMVNDGDSTMYNVVREKIFLKIDDFDVCDYGDVDKINEKKKVVLDKFEDLFYFKKALLLFLVSNLNPIDSRVLSQDEIRQLKQESRIGASYLEEILHFKGIYPPPV